MTSWEIDNIIQSPTGKRMLSRVSPIYDNSIFMKFFYEGVGSEYDKVRKYFATLREQSFTKTVDWGIELQERKYSVIPDDSLTLEQRRERLKIKLQSKYPLNPAILEKHALDRFGLDVYLDEKSNPGYITMDINGFNTAQKFINWLITEKPAHLMILARLHKIVPFKAYAGIAHHKWGRKRLNRLERVKVEPDKTTDTLNERTFIIEPNKVTVIRGDQQEIITPVLPFDQLKLKFAFPSGSRTITLNNPRQDVTAADIQAVADYATEHELLLKVDDAVDDLTSARLVSITEIPIIF